MNLDIRSAWLDYYQSLGFKTIPGAGLVHPLFPMSFNMSAGLVQLDPQIRSPQKVTPKKQCLVQKCFRHFDVDKVGDKSHLSFFEMTGAFEIGTFSQSQTVKYLWDFLTIKLKIDPGKLWITSFNRGEIAGKEIVQPDELKQYLEKLSNGRIVYGNRDNPNFWTQGGGANLTDNLKLCGPQVEIFYDLGKDKGCSRTNCNPFCSCSRFLETGNIIFIKYCIDCNREPVLKELLNPSTESVIGLERTALIVEKKTDIYTTSYFTSLVRLVGPKINEDVRIMTDHIKALTFLLTEEKILPGRNGRNRIIRTLIRNLLTSCYVLKLNSRQILPRLIEEVISLYQNSYPEIRDAAKTVTEVIFSHEIVYQKTLEKAKRKIQKYLKDNNVSQITQKDKEYFREQFGIPVELQDRSIVYES